MILFCTSVDWVLGWEWRIRSSAWICHFAIPIRHSSGELNSFVARVANKYQQPLYFLDQNQPFSSCGIELRSLNPFQTAKQILNLKNRECPVGTCTARIPFRGRVPTWPRSVLDFSFLSTPTPISISSFSAVLSSLIIILGFIFLPCKLSLTTSFVSFSYSFLL